jgi:hypothetical protein
MRVTPLLACGLLAVACNHDLDAGPPTADEAPFDSATTGAGAPPEGACGPVHYVDLEIRGIVQDGSGLPAAGVEVWLDERAWVPTTIHGQAMTDADGHFAFPATELPIVERCWGFAALFHIAAQDLEAYGEIDANYPIISAYLANESVADFDVRPVVLQAEG